MFRAGVLAVTVLASVGVASGGPPTREEMERRNAVIEQLGIAINSEPTAAAKFAAVVRLMAAERDPDVRRRILERAATVAGLERETFLTDTLANDPDAGIRSEAAKHLGRVGSERALGALAKAAGTDPTTVIQMGDIASQSSARRAATFAIAELAARHPAIAKDAVDRLRAIDAVQDAPDNEQLPDARAQAIYQITRDAALLEPFLKRLKSDDPKVRESGVVAFRFFKLTEAPAELVATLKDPDVEVRRWAALVLGEIGDPKTVEALKAAAADEDNFVRANIQYSLKKMKAAP